MAKADVFKFAVHPAARIFPMLPDDELDELAADIKANGLLHPLIVKDGVLIDGRNRREACKRAGVEPRVQELNGEDAYAYIISSNINRRHMTKGQRAMAVAMIYPEADERGRGKKAAAGKSAEVSGFSVRLLQQARTVLKWAPELADAVLAGAESLDRAYEVAVDRKAQAERPELRLRALRAKAPDLADKVAEEQLSLDDAEDAARGRAERERAQRQGMYDSFNAIQERIRIFSEGENRDYFVRIVLEHGDELSHDDVKSEICAWIENLSKTVQALG